MKAFFLFLSSLLLPPAVKAQCSMSPMVRQVVMSIYKSRGNRRHALPALRSAQMLTAFVKTDGTDGVLAACGCRDMAGFGSLHIAEIPLERIAVLARSRHVLRIEASPAAKACMDTTTVITGAEKAWNGIGGRAFTGRGVVAGVMDIGFDLTHPNFLDADGSRLRVSRMWDQLSVDTIGSRLPVGRDYAGSELLSVMHSRDGLTQTHGTHTLGIVAGTGWQSPYVGMAPNSDICLVANAAGDNSELIAEEDRYKYTTATDALGFKYIFDYAASVHKPCVISFSEGSNEGAGVDQKLYYEFLDSLTGPGRIIVASAGNAGAVSSYFRKPRGVASAGCFLQASAPVVGARLIADADYRLRFTAWNAVPDTFSVDMSRARLLPDSVLVDSFRLADGVYKVQYAAYADAFDSSKAAYEMAVTCPAAAGQAVPLSVEVVGADADVEYFRAAGSMTTDSRAPQLDAAECSHNVNSPAAAPAVIAVGATSWRQTFTNYKGTVYDYHNGSGGVRAPYSSTGPTMAGLVKPDVMAPGTNVISSYSSFYMENNPDAGDLNSDVERFTYNGRTYSWNANTGTSMAAPVVAGAVALWLEADSMLTPERALDVMRRTCRRMPSEEKSNSCGYGEIDAYRGLLFLLGVDGIKEISQRQAGADIMVSAGMLAVQLPETAGRKVVVSLYALNGRRVAAAVVARGEKSCTMNVSHLDKGVYIVQINGKDAFSGSRIVRL